METCRENAQRQVLLVPRGNDGMLDKLILKKKLGINSGLKELYDVAFASLHSAQIFTLRYSRHRKDHFLHAKLKLFMKRNYHIGSLMWSLLVQYLIAVPFSQGTST